jgi:hypothetical protein
MPTDVSEENAASIHDSENKGDMFLQKLGLLSRDCMALFS